MSLLRFYSIVIPCNLIFFTLFYLFLPALRFNLIAENQFLENLSAIFYFDAFVFGLFFLSKLNKFSSVCILIPIMGLLGFLDEISFGQNFFSLEMPMVGRTRIDGVHDIFSLAKELNSPTKGLLSSFLYSLRIQFPNIYQQLVLLGKISILLLLGWAVFLIIKKRWRIMNAGWSFLHKYPSFQFVLLALSFGVISQAIDLRFIRHPLLSLMGSFVEETFEMNIALSILFASFAIRNIRTSGSSLHAEPSQLTEISGQIDVQHN